MYRIQAYNYVKSYFNVINCNTMQERDSQIQSLLDSQEFTRAGISWEWIARY